MGSLQESCAEPDKSSRYFPKLAVGFLVIAFTAQPGTTMRDKVQYKVHS